MTKDEAEKKNKMNLMEYLLKSLKMEYFHEVMMKKKNKRLGIEKKKIISKMKVDLMIIKSLID